MCCEIDLIFVKNPGIEKNNRTVYCLLLVNCLLFAYYGRV